MPCCTAPKSFIQKALGSAPLRHSELVMAAAGFRALLAEMAPTLDEDVADYCVGGLVDAVRCHGPLFCLELPTHHTDTHATA